MPTERAPWIPPAATAVCFDAFGTLVEIADRRAPYRRILRWLDGVPARALLTTTPDLSAVPPPEAEAFRSDVEAEVASVRLREGAADAWREAREAGLLIAVCSNLATPYGPPLLAALPGPPDAAVLSYEAGLAKPDPLIYRLVCERLGLSPAEIVFVGDTWAADVEGPRLAGMEARHVDEVIVPGAARPYPASAGA